MTPYLIMSGVIIALAVICFFSIKRNFKLSGKVKAYETAAEKTAETQEKRAKIVEEHNENEKNIVSDPIGSTADVMPESKTAGKHNHAFREPCTPGCPAYIPD